MMVLEGPMIDIHAHILPGMDDGPVSIEESLAICRMAAADGIKNIVATPHVYPGIYNNGRKKILDKVGQLNRLVKEEGIGLEILPGADIHLTPELFLQIENGDLMGINNTSYLLIELPEILPVRCAELIFDLKAKGYTPIISHPERNHDIQRNPDRLRRLIDMGALAQLTAMSLTGGFGYIAKRSARSLLEQGLIHIIATDTHSPDKRPPILSRAVKMAGRIVGEGVAYSMVYNTPMRIAGISA